MSINSHQTELPKAAFPIIINKLLEFDTQGFKGCLFWAAENGYVDIYKLLMEKVDDKNLADSSGTTPLHVAAKKGHLEICQLIMENIVDKNPADVNGKTPLPPELGREESQNEKWTHTYPSGSIKQLP